MYIQAHEGLGYATKVSTTQRSNGLSGLAESIAIKPANYQIYLTVTGAQQGNFKGAAKGKGHEGQMPALKFWYEVKSPTNALRIRRSESASTRRL